MIDQSNQSDAVLKQLASDNKLNDKINIHLVSNTSSNQPTKSSFQRVQEIVQKSKQDIAGAASAKQLRKNENSSPSMMQRPAARGIE